ncbi:MAG: aminoacyl-tRNA hydrolase [Deltaproteobacteria bacterium]|nr:aminoacyl-tRNA hydrolase [Deltaproteobacteria bacterium]
MWLIVGLGNPGQRYKATRHNLGFKVIDLLAQRTGIKMTKDRAQAKIGRGSIQSGEVILAQPQTFMNLSGSSVARLLAHFRLGVEDLIVAHDDLDLPLGRLKLTRGGGSGGHKGVASIIDSLGRQDFCRLKMGLGRPQEPDEEMSRFVLRPFGPEEADQVEAALIQGAKAIETVVSQGLAKAQSLFNRSVEKHEAEASEPLDLE